MKIKWEKNSRVLALADAGKIKHEDIIPRTHTVHFPAEMATVRMARLSDKSPFVTVHIRGEGEKKTSYGGDYTWINALTMRVNMPQEGKYYSLSGELDGDLSFQDVHNTITKVKEIME
tara:strand:+ start:937 stop:1290 length:354 start_codon:yes stop_codon:yes gene_type:complete